MPILTKQVVIGSRRHGKNGGHKESKKRGRRKKEREGNYEGSKLKAGVDTVKKTLYGERPGSRFLRQQMGRPPLAKVYRRKRRRKGEPDGGRVFP